MYARTIQKQNQIRGRKGGREGGKEVEGVVNEEQDQLVREDCADEFCK